MQRWYQMFSDLSTSVFETNYCVTADYGINPNGTVSVHNRDRRGSVTGGETEIFGYAEAADPSAPGELTVYLQGVPVGAPYWIFTLGAVVNGQYEYAVVSDPLQLTLFVLARNVTTWYSKYNATVYASLLAEGFNNFLNSPVPTNHIGCTYWPL